MRTIGFAPQLGQVSVLGVSVVDLFISKIKNPSQQKEKKKILGGSGR